MPETIEIKSTDKPLNKSEAYHIARLLVTDPEAVSMAERRGLLLHFAPSAGRVPKTAREYVAQFVAKPSEFRYHLQYLWSDGSKLWATDGAAAAWCPTELPEGYYHPRTGDPVEVEGSFPGLPRVIPEKRKREPLILEDWKGEEAQGIKGADLRLVSPAGVRFSRALVLRAMKGCASVTYQEALKGPHTYTPMRGAVKLKAGEVAQFVIMPIKD